MISLTFLSRSITLSFLDKNGLHYLPILQNIASTSRVLLTASVLFLSWSRRFENEYYALNIITYLERPLKILFFGSDFMTNLFLVEKTFLHKISRRLLRLLLALLLYKEINLIFEWL